MSGPAFAALPSAPPAARLAELLDRCAGVRLLVLGDMVADEHLIGVSQAVAREAPVVVLRYVRQYVLPGGATNPAYNAAVLGAQVAVCGVIGDDPSGAALRGQLAAAGIDVAGLLVDPSRPTTTKTRIWGGGTQQQVQQLLLRIDRVDRRPVEGPLGGGLTRFVLERLPEVDALLISDYENGVIGRGLIDAVLPAAARAGKLVGIDSHGDLFRFRGATVATPNQPEAEATLGLSIEGPDDLERAGRRLLEGLGAQAVLITRGKEGMSLFTREGPGGVHLPAVALGAAVDPTGAGDTVAATFILALAAGATPLEAAHLANLAAGIVVTRMGAATASPAELRAAIARLYGAP